jgi:hypothetical protein
VVGPKDLFFASGIVSGGAGVLDEATPAIVAAIALLVLGGISGVLWCWCRCNSDS